MAWQLVAAGDHLHETATGRISSLGRAVLLPPIDSPQIRSAIGRAIAAAEQSVILPRVRDPAEVQHLDVLLTVAETEAGQAVGATTIIAVCGDTAEGVLFGQDFRRLSTRLKALAFDASALMVSIGLADSIDRDPEPLRVARANVILAAAAAGLKALDMATDPADPALFRLECEEARRQGFHGRIARQAWQAEIIAAVFDRR
ncbi:aldolase/citrate lyase family protein [Rhizobium sp. SAFR-030]|uniref:aldolase/citrate lyase family protein n=1 Tax=Rhizobium sp. SAFR-030 TaxID=3387277 RepID=UPI003F8082DA